MNSLYIGLGGAGTYAVAALYQKFLHYGYDVTQDHFLFIDTDERIKNSYPFINDTNFFPLAGANNQRISATNIVNSVCRNPDLPANHAFSSWFDPIRTELRSEESLHKGAEGVRMLTRVMLWANYSPLSDTLQANMNYTDGNGQSQPVNRIYVVSGMCGGTGSGSVIDLLYMLQEIAAKNNPGNANQLPINLMLVMPAGYLKNLAQTDVRRTNYVLNAYALIDELNACLKDYHRYYDSNKDSMRNTDGTISYNLFLSNKDAGRQFFKYKCWDSNPPVKFNFQVFQNAYLFDSFNKIKGVLSHAEVSDNISNFIFALEVGITSCATLDTTISNLVRATKNASSTAPFIKGFGATGLFVAQTWEELLRKYCREKFTYQMLYYGFVGSAPFTLSDAEKAGFNNQFSRSITAIRDECLGVQSGNGIGAQIDKILATYSKDQLNKVHENIKACLSEKSPDMGKIFPNAAADQNVQPLSKQVDNMLKQVKDTTYAQCGAWIKRYSLSHVAAIVTHLDTVYDSLYKEKSNDIQAGEIANPLTIRGSIKEKAKRASCRQAFEQYLDYLIARNLSNAADGYLDRCIQCLDNAIHNINISQYRLPDGSKLMDWERDYIKYLSSMNNDPTRYFYPSLDTLCPNGTLVSNNALDAAYGGFVQQAAGQNVPVLSDTGQSQELYHYKQTLLKQFLTKNPSWQTFFSIDNGGNSFDQHARAIFDNYVREVCAYAQDFFAKDPALTRNFSDAYSQMDVNEQDKLAGHLKAFNRVTLSLDDPVAQNSTQTVYVGDFQNQNLAQLKKTLMPPAGQMKVEFGEDAKINDRVVKVFVEFGHDLSEYAYYETYTEFFKGWLRGGCDHQPYIHKDFLPYIKEHLSDQKPSSLADLFVQRGVADRREIVRGFFKDHENLLLKLCVAFLYQALTAAATQDGRIMKPFQPLGNFVVSSDDKQTITFHTSEDFASRATIQRSTYRASQAAYVILLCANKKYSRADIQKLWPGIRFWLDVLEESLKGGDITEYDLLDAFAKNESQSGAFFDIDALHENDTERAFLNRLYAKYVHTEGTESKFDRPRFYADCRDCFEN
ncbi:MAG: tubulin-like doman-containing protein [Candidatus Limimorpha sp.]